MLIETLTDHGERITLWGLVATAVLTTVLYASQGLGLSRLSLPFLLGTLFTGRRMLADLLGFLLYLIGGWVFALLYFLIMTDLGIVTWWLGGAIGVLHAVFLLVVVLPLMPSLHPRIATEYDGPSATRRIEPPGFLGLNYGYRTPLTTIVAHLLFGALLGAAFSAPI